MRSVSEGARRHRPEAARPSGRASRSAGSRHQSGQIARLVARSSGWLRVSGDAGSPATATASGLPSERDGDPSPHQGRLRHLASGKIPAGGDHDEPGCGEPGTGGGSPEAGRRRSWGRPWRADVAAAQARRRPSAAARRGAGDGVARTGVTAATRPADGEELESGRLEARPGGMRLERELLEAKITSREGRRPSASADPPAGCQRS